MIDFRYHLVSIVAVFLALALGIVLGTTTLNHLVENDFRHQVNVLRDQRNAADNQADALQSRVSADNNFAAAVEPLLESDQLTGQRIAVISAPGVASGMRTSILDALTRAGAELATQIRLSGTYLDPRQAAALGQLAASLTVPSPQQGQTPTPSAQAAAELAPALVRAAGNRRVDDATGGLTIAGYQRAGFLSVDGSVSRPATLALLLVPGAPKVADPATSAANQGLADLAMALRNQGGRLVIAGPESAASGAGFLATARGLRELARVVSTVDSADTAQGRIALVLALRAAMNGDSHPYGSGPGAVSPLPSISASPAGALTSSGHR